MGDDDQVSTPADGDKALTSTASELEELLGSDTNAEAEATKPVVSDDTDLDKAFETYEAVADEQDKIPTHRRSFGQLVLGLLALLLGSIGVAAAIVGGAMIVWAGLTASSAVDKLVTPLTETVDRLDTRIDQADDAVDREGIDADRMPELRARAEGLADVALGAQELASDIRDHPIYRWLPAELDPLAETIDDYAIRANRINDIVDSTGEGRPLAAGPAGEVTDELNTLQSAVRNVEETVDNAAGSLKKWIRIASFLGLLVAIWSGWAQYCLARRGLRGMRGTGA